MSDQRQFSRPGRVRRPQVRQAEQEAIAADKEPAAPAAAFAQLQGAVGNQAFSTWLSAYRGDPPANPTRRQAVQRDDDDSGGGLSLSIPGLGSASVNLSSSGISGSVSTGLGSASGSASVSDNGISGSGNVNVAGVGSAAASGSVSDQGVSGAGTATSAGGSTIAAAGSATDQGTEGSLGVHTAGGTDIDLHGAKTEDGFSDSGSVHTAGGTDIDVAASKSGGNVTGRGSVHTAAGTDIDVSGSKSDAGVVGQGSVHTAGGTDVDVAGVGGNGTFTGRGSVRTADGTEVDAAGSGVRGGPITGKAGVLFADGTGMGVEGSKNGDRVTGKGAVRGAGGAGIDIGGSRTEDGFSGYGDVRTVDGTEATVVGSGVRGAPITGKAALHTAGGTDILVKSPGTGGASGAVTAGEAAEGAALPGLGLSAAELGDAAEAATAGGQAPEAPGGAPGKAPAGAGGHPVLRQGSSGPSVKELQEKLNGHRADPQLKVDGIFGPLTRGAVVKFQSAQHLAPDGVAGPHTWGALDAPVTPPKGDPVAPADPGKSKHPTIRLGDSGAAVTEVQEKLSNISTGPLKVPATGAFDAMTLMAVLAFQAARGLTISGTVDEQTWAAIDATGVGSDIGRVEKPWSENVGGVTYAMTSRFTWQITDSQVIVSVNLNFAPDPGVTAPTARWLGAIQAMWNKFHIVNVATGKSLALIFNPVAVASGGDNNIRVKAGNGRSDAGNWYVGDPNSDETACHEFGHMIGLEDEYQRGHTDYKRLTGDAPGEGQKTGDAAPGDVAKDLNTALQVTPIKPDRINAAQAVITNHNLQQGDFAQLVAAAYQTQFSTDLVADVVKSIPSASQWNIVDPFTYSGNSLMGLGTDHTHPVQPRHVREFVAYVKADKGGEWEAQ